MASVSASVTPVMISCVSVRAMLGAAQACGLASDALADQAGLGDIWRGARADDNDGFVERERVVDMWGRIVASSDPAIGIRMGRAVAPDSHRGLAYLSRSSPDLIHALRHFVRFQVLLRSDLVAALVEHDDGRVDLAYVPDYELESAAERAWVEYGVSTMVSLTLAMTGGGWAPAQIEFRHRRPPELAAYAGLRGPVLFARPRTQIVFDAGACSTAMVEADPVLCEVLQDALERTLEALPSLASTAERARRELARMFPGEEPSLERLGKRLGIGPRTLQRRLRDEGTTFAELVDEVREQLARRYLGEGQLSVIDTALLLGYSDARAFSRAFKRWTGISPARVRRPAD